MPITEGGRFSPVDRIVSPGVFTRENDLSGIAQGVADIGGAIVAPFPKGPAFTPTLIRDVTTLEEKFGVADGVYYGPYTAKEYLIERGFVTICRVGALTGYKQQYPFVIWALNGNYLRELACGSFVSGSSTVTITTLSGSIVEADNSPTTATETASYIKGATVSASINITFTGPPLHSEQTSSNKIYNGQTIDIGTVTFTGMDFQIYNEEAPNDTYSALSASISRGTTAYDRFTASLYSSGNLSASNGSIIGMTGNLPFNWSNNIPSPFTSNITLMAASLYQCADRVLLARGNLTGSFGPYSGIFNVSGTPTLDICTNEWTSSNADYRVLAILSDTQYNPPVDLVSAGFSGSLFYQGPQSGQTSQSVFETSTSSSISKDYAVRLKSSNSSTAYGNYAFSIDPASPKYITNVFGDEPTAGKPPIARGQKIEAAYLYKVFENQIAKVAAEPTKWYVSGSFLPNGVAMWAGEPLNFTDDYSRDLNNGDSIYSITHATTPWIISQAVASWDNTSAPTRFRLFKAHTLADGTYTNTSYKLEISNVKLAGQVAGSDWGSFTLTLRKYSDTDKKNVILETFQNLNLDPDSSNYVARRIGDRYNYINFAGKIIEFGTYSNNSKYIRIEMATTPWAISAVPAGFEALVTPVNSSMAHWVVPVRYSRASIYGVDPGKYASGIAFNDAPTGADAELQALFPTSSVGNGVEDDNKQYFAPMPAFGAYPSIGRNTNFALDQTTADWGFDKPASTGTYLAAALSGSVPFIYDASNESTYVKMRKFAVGFQGGFDGQSPSIPINVGSDIIPGNTQGLDCTDITTAGSIAYKQCVGALGNADEFDINLIALPGIVHQHHPYVTNLVVDMCEKRGDCFYIMDFHITPATEGSVGQIDEVVGYAASYDTNYAAGYYPWIKILDTNTNKIITIPPSVVLPAIYASNDKVAAEWFAPAGLNRGGITQAIQVCDRTTHEERDTLYEGKVNPIAAFPGQGICVWGQKTLQNAASALDRVNVRRLLIKIKKFFASTAKYLVFEQNVASTRNKFLAIVNPYLESIQQRSGLYAFQVVMDDTNNTPDLIDRNILYGQIYLKPTKTAEFIILDFDILPTGAVMPGA